MSDQKTEAQAIEELAKKIDELKGSQDKEIVELVDELFETIDK